MPVFAMVTDRPSSSEDRASVKLPWPGFEDVLGRSHDLSVMKRDSLGGSRTDWEAIAHKEANGYFQKENAYLEDFVSLHPSCR